MTQQVQQGMAVRSAPLQRPSCWCRSSRNRSRISRRSQRYHEDGKGVNEWQVEPLADMQMKWGVFLVCAQETVHREKGACCEVTV